MELWVWVLRSMKFIKMLSLRFNENQCRQNITMKQVENLHRVVKEMVDLTSCEDNINGTLLPDESIKMPELALVMAKYFTSLGKYCLSFYSSYNKKQKTQKKPKVSSKEAKLDAPPRKPITAYISYYQEKVPIFQQKYQNCSISELTRLIAKQWSDLAEEDKSPYILRAKNDKKRYEKEREQYKHKHKFQREEIDSGEQKMEQVIHEDSQVEVLKKENEMKQKQEQISQHKEN